MKETLDLFPDHPAPQPATMLELVAMPGIKLSPTQRAFKQLVQNIDAIEQQLKEIAGLADVFRPLFDKTLQPLQDQQDKVNREMLLFLDAHFASTPRQDWARLRSYGANPWCWTLGTVANGDTASTCTRISSGGVDCLCLRVFLL